MRNLDFTQGIKLNENREIELTVEYHNGNRYSYSASSKKECLKAFKSKWGCFKGFVSKEYRVYDSELLDYVEA